MANAASTRFRGGPGKERLQRSVIVAAVAISVVWAVAAALIHVRVFWLLEVLQGGPVLVFLAAVVASGLLGKARPAAFEVREGVGFVVPATRGFGFLVVGEVAMVAFLTGPLIRLWTWGGADAAVFHLWDLVVLSAIWLIACGLVTLLVVAALRGRPRILLTPRAVVQEGWWASRTIPWEALRPGQPVRQVRGRTLTLIVDRPELVVRRGRFRSSTGRPWLATGQLRVHPGFLAAAIWFYVGHPQRRATIGARAEYERVVAELNVTAGA